MDQIKEEKKFIKDTCNNVVIQNNSEGVFSAINYNLFNIKDSFFRIDSMLKTMDKILDQVEKNLDDEKKRKQSSLAIQYIVQTINKLLDTKIKNNKTLTDLIKLSNDVSKQSGSIGDGSLSNGDKLFLQSAIKQMKDQFSIQIESLKQKIVEYQKKGKNVDNKKSIIQT